MRPCDENKPCIYEDYDEQNYCNYCSIDYEGLECPYTKPWGKKKYIKENVKEVQNDNK